MKLLHETVVSRYVSRSRWYKTDKGRYVYELATWNEPQRAFVKPRQLEVDFQDLPKEAQRKAFEP